MMKTQPFHKRDSRTATLVINSKHTLMSLSTQELWKSRYECCMAIIFTGASPACNTHHTLLHGLFMSGVRVKSDLSAMKTTSQVGRAENSSGSTGRQCEDDAFFCQPPQSHHLLPSLTFIQSDDTPRSLWWAPEQQKGHDAPLHQWLSGVSCRWSADTATLRLYMSAWISNKLEGVGGGWLKSNSLSLSWLVTFDLILLSSPAG